MMRTEAPSAANRSATTLPIPAAPPVTTAVLPSIPSTARLYLAARTERARRVRADVDRVAGVISGIVLAAGTGSRFGGTKQLVEAGGRALVLHAIDALDEADEIVVVTGHDDLAVARILPENVRVLHNPRYRDGQATSLAAGLHALDETSEAVVVLMADQPGITAQHVRALVDRFRATRGRVVRLAFRNGPGPALLSREIYGEAGHLEGDVGARVLFASHPDWVEDVEVDEDVPRDIDTPADL